MVFQSKFDAGNESARKRFRDVVCSTLNLTGLKSNVYAWAPVSIANRNKQSQHLMSWTNKKRGWFVFLHDGNEITLR